MQTAIYTPTQLSDLLDVDVTGINPGDMLVWDGTAFSPQPFLGGGITFADIGGTISLDQFPPGSVATLDSIGADALFFFDDSTGLPKLISSAEAAAFVSLSLTFSDLGGQISMDQLPAGSVATLDTIGADAIYFFDNDTGLPLLIDSTTAATFVGLPLNFADILGTLSIDQFPAGTVTTLDSLDEDALYFFDNTLFVPKLINASDTRTFIGIDTDVTLAANSDDRIPSQKAVKAYVDASGGGGGTGDVVGPGVAVNNRVVFFDGTTGKLIKDSGLTLSGSNTGDQDLSGYQPLDSDLTTLAGLTATTDNFIISVASAWASRTPAQARTTLGLVIGTNVQAWDADLDSWAAITRASGFDTFATTPSSANFASLLTDESGSSGGFVRSGGGAVTGLTGLAIRSTGAAFDLTFASSEVLTAGRTLSVVMGDAARTLTFTGNASISGTNTGDQDLSGYQPLDSDLTTIAGLTATTDNFIASVSSAWASRTPSQVRTTLGLVIGTNVQAWDADLDALAALSGTNTIYYRSAANTWSGVTIGSGLTFSGGSLTANAGSGVATDAIFDAKGDLAVGTGADTSAKLTVGANDTILMADSTQTTGLKWGTPSTVRTALSLVIGTNVQAWDADLDTWAGITPASGAGTFLATPSSANLRAFLTDETGTGAAVFGTAPTISSPVVDTDPYGVVFIKFSTGINLQSVATTNIYTVPAGRTALVLMYKCSLTAKTGAITTHAIIGMTESGGGSGMTPTTTLASEAAGNVISGSGALNTGTGTNSNVCTAGNTIRFNVSQASNGTTLTADVLVAILVY